jgi:hypothetical protein
MITDAVDRDIGRRQTKGAPGTLNEEPRIAIRNSAEDRADERILTALSLACIHQEETGAVDDGWFDRSLCEQL